MRKTINQILNILLFVILFFAIQWMVMSVVGIAVCLYHGGDWAAATGMFRTGSFAMGGKAIVLSSFLSSLSTILLFGFCKWSPFSNAYIRTRPWISLTWVLLLSVGTILPSQWLMEQITIEMPEETVRLFEQIMKEPFGYLVIGILSPVAEEMVFRGAVQRTLLNMLSKQNHWWAIVAGALVFGACHMNMPQFVHAFLIGLLLGWMYYRTGSVVPGIVLHWVNNSVAFVMFSLMPKMADGKLIDLFHGDSRTMISGLAFSLCILVPSLFQLSRRLK